MNPSLASSTPSIHETSTASAPDSSGGALYAAYSYISAGMGAVYEGIVGRVEETAWKSGYPGMGRQAVSVVLGAVSMLLFTLAFSWVCNRFAAKGAAAREPQQRGADDLHAGRNVQQKRPEELSRDLDEANEKVAGLVQKIKGLELEWEKAQDASSQLLNETTERAAGLEEQIGVLERERQKAQEESSRRLDEADKKDEELKLTVSRLTQELSDANRQQGDLRAQLEVQQQTEMELLQKLEEANQRKEELRRGISHLKQDLSEGRRVQDGLRTQLQEVQERLKTVQGESDPAGKRGNAVSETQGSQAEATAEQVS